MKTETLAYAGAIVIILALIIAVTVLLVFRIIALDQVGPFLMVLVVPLTTIAGLPIFKAALAAPSPEQSAQLQQLHSQSIQALAQAAQPAPVQTVPPAQVIQQPFPPLTVPLAAMPRQ